MINRDGIHLDDIYIHISLTDDLQHGHIGIKIYMKRCIEKDVEI